MTIPEYRVGSCMYYNYYYYITLSFFLTFILKFSVNFVVLRRKNVFNLKNKVFTIQNYMFKKIEHLKY